MMPEYVEKMIFKKGHPNYGGKGYLHVLDDEEFVPAYGTQYVRFSPVKPREVIEREVNDYLDYCGVL